LKGKLPKQVSKVVLPKHIKTIAPTRQWIGEYALRTMKLEKFVMMDDDLKLFRRKDKDSHKLQPVDDKDLVDMFTWISKTLDSYAHCGISAREGNGHIKKDFVINTRMMRVIGYRTAMFNYVKHNRLQVMEDFDVTLQLLRLGCENIVNFTFANNQLGGSNYKGGCSEFRTLKVQRKAALKLAKLFPDYVTAYKKKMKSAWEGKERTDVRVQWKKAHNVT